MEQLCECLYPGLHPGFDREMNAADHAQNNN